MVIAGEVLDGRSILEACVGCRLNICQPCASALTQEQDPELGFTVSRTGSSSHGEQESVPASQDALGRYWKVIYSPYSARMSLPSFGNLNLTAQQ